MSKQPVLKVMMVMMIGIAFHKLETEGFVVVIICCASEDKTLCNKR